MICLNKIKQFTNCLWDTLDSFSGSGDDFALRIPPRKINYNSKFHLLPGPYRREFISYTKILLNLLTSFGNIGKTTRILDVGCGFSPLAFALLNSGDTWGSYTGIDMSETAISWCQKSYQRFSNMSFHHLNVSVDNRLYGGNLSEIKADEINWPFPNQGFDVVFSTSLFTHMNFKAVDKYIHETSRVLAPGGICIHTFFLINEQSRKAMTESAASHIFIEIEDGFFATRSDFVENATGFEESKIRQLYQKHSLTISHPIVQGTWMGNNSKYYYQDIIIAKK